MSEIQRALRGFDAQSFCVKHGGHKESRNPKSQEYLFHCPLCGSSNLRWNPTKQDYIGGWVCWGCGQRGNTLYLIQLFEQCTLVGAQDFVLSGYVGGDAKLELTDIAEVKVVPKMKKRDRLPPIAWPAQAIDARQHAVVRQYLHGRGISDAMIEYWGIRAGVRGREKNYAIFPCYMDGNMVYWQARAAWDPPATLSKEGKKKWVEATRYRKTLNPINPMPGIRQATAGEVLFNYERAAGHDHVVVVEGPVDAIKVGPQAVALFGKGTEEKIYRLRSIRVSRYTIYLDRGAEEIAKATEIAKALSGWAQVFLAVPPEGYDAGDLTPEANAAVIHSAAPATASELHSNLVIS